MSIVRRAAIYFVLAAIAGLIGAVGLAGELGAHVTKVDGIITGTHTENGSGANGGSRTIFFVDVEREDTGEQVSVRNALFFDAFQASHDEHVTLDIRSTGKGVERVAEVHYLGQTYKGTTAAEGIGVAIAFLVLTAVFLVLAIRRTVVTRRAAAAIPPTPTLLPPPTGKPV